MLRRDLADSLVLVRIEGRAGFCVNRGHAMLGKLRVQLFLRHLNAAEQILARFGQDLALFIRKGCQRAREIVGDAEKVACELFYGIGARIDDFLLGPLADIFHFRMGA